MTVNQIQAATDRARLINACNNLAHALDAKKAEYANSVIERKGKTLYRINRERSKSVKMTVNY